jgi:adenosine deaminase
VTSYSGTHENLISLVKLLPKVELHLHLEGSIQIKRFLKLSQKYQTRFSQKSVEEIRKNLFTYSDFGSFLKTYKIVCEHLREPEDYVALVEDLSSYLESQNIHYAELFISPSIPTKNGFNTHKILQDTLKASKKLAAELSIELHWIFDCVRQFGPRAAWETAELAQEFHDKGVVGVGLGGDETQLTCLEFEAVFSWAKAQGLYVHIHAGEIGDPKGIWDALKILGANRIGHGIQAARDQSLMSYLKNHAIGLDICLTSNVRTKVWTPLSKNPFWLLYKRGVPVTLNTDDPGLFDITLEQEYRNAIQAFEMGRSDVFHLMLQGIRSSFLDHGKRMKLMQEFQNAIHELTLRDN